MSNANESFDFVSLQASDQMWWYHSIAAFIDQ